LRLAVAAAIAATLAWRFLVFTGFTNDHYAHLALAQQLLLGDRPIRDFSDPGWPLTYLLSAAAWRVAGDAMVVEWALTAVAFAIGSAFTVWAAHRLSGSVGIAVLAAALQIAIFPRTYAYPKIAVYAVGTVVILMVAAKPSRGRIWLLAGLVATAFLLRHDHGLYLGAAAAVTIALATRHDGWRSATRRVAELTAVTAIILLPWILFVSLNGGVPRYFSTALEYARGEANASNLRAWPTFSRRPGQPLFGLAPANRPLLQVQWTDNTTDDTRQALERRYGLELARVGDDSSFYSVRDTSEKNLETLDDDPHVAGTIGLGRVRRPIWREYAATLSPFRIAPALHSDANADAWLFWLFWALPLLCALILSWRVWRGSPHWPNEAAAIAALIVLAVAVNAGFLRDVLRTRLSDAIVPAVLLGAWALGCCRGNAWRWRPVQRVVQLAAIIILGVTAVAVARVGEVEERLERTGLADGFEATQMRAREVATLLRQPHRQAVAPPSYVSAALMPFYRYVDRCMPAADRLLVTGEFPDVPVLAGRRFASDGVVMGAWYSSEVRQDDTLRRMRAQPPLFVVYLDPRAFTGRFPVISRYVDTEYRSFAAIDTPNAGSTPILVHSARRPQRKDAETGWPCFQ
jgi:hypothetical protein